MSETPELKRLLNRRLMPLYLSAFLQSVVLWYSVEKLFMQSIGFNPASLGLMIAVYSAVMLAVETPSGILADRWSRKGVLMLASLILIISAVVGGMSHNVPQYLIHASIWGIFFACFSGMYDSIIYDTIAEHTDSSKLFDSLYGRLQMVDSIGLVVGALAGGLIASRLGLRETYFLTIPFCLLAMAALLAFREPTLHKKQVLIPIKRQLGITFRAVLRNRALLPIVIVLILQASVVYCMYEFYQLWLLAQHTSTAYYGLVSAVVLASYGAGGFTADRGRLTRYPVMLAALVLLLLSCIGLMVLRNTFALVAAQFILGSLLMAVSVIFNRLLHDGLGPSIRAGASSAVSTISRFVIIPLALLFGYVSKELTVYKAAGIFLGLSLIMVLFVVAVANRNGRTGLEAV